MGRERVSCLPSRVSLLKLFRNKNFFFLFKQKLSLEGLMLKLKLQYFGHLMQSQFDGKDSDAGKD